MRQKTNQNALDKLLFLLLLEGAPIYSQLIMESRGQEEMF